MSGALLQRHYRAGITRLTALFAAAMLTACGTSDTTSTTPTLPATTATETTIKATTTAPQQITVTLTDDPLTPDSGLYAFFFRETGSATCTFLIDVDITVAARDDTILAQATIPEQFAGAAVGDTCTASADVTIPGDSNELIVTVDQGNHLAWQITATPDADNRITVSLEPENHYTEGW
ncbi:hypothetical protein [Actinobaculum sp. 352]|uniref:hypothetical protein n=1 Tax=Actinobaculum sp. 352 TaxID=2490946 RepID=UPI000F7E802A|nr:hypothetical protein [Actinobaculum sp. 352]RTE47906.1 hypothetical protein EKN07_11645 [Actinobaculum sp. 352]